MMEEIISIDGLRISLISSFLKFSNLNLMTAEEIIKINSCNGCKSVADLRRIDYFNICKNVSETLSFMEMLIEILSSSSCVSNASKIDFASNCEELAKIIRLFLTRM